MTAAAQEPASEDNTGQDSQTAPAETAASPDESTLNLNLPEETPAGENGDPEIPTVPAPGLGDFLRMILFLGLVIAAIYLFFYFLKRLSGRTAAESGLIRLLGSRSLKGEASVHLVEIGNQTFLVGSGSANLISEITDKETLDGPKLELAAAPEELPPSVPGRPGNGSGSGPGCR